MPTQFVVPSHRNTIPARFLEPGTVLWLPSAQGTRTTSAEWLYKHKSNVVYVLGRYTPALRLRIGGQLSQLCLRPSIQCVYL